MTAPEPRAAAPGARTGPVSPAALATDPAVRDAAAELAASREALAGELGALKASARAAVDVKAQVRRHPGKAAAAVGGTAFLAVGGPRKLFRAVKRRIVGAPEPLPPSLLPAEIEKAVRAMGEDGAKVRGALERGFAGYLEVTSKDRKAEARQRSLVNLALKVGLPIVTRAGKEAVARLVRETAGGAGARGTSAAGPAGADPETGSPDASGGAASR